MEFTKFYTFTLSSKRHSQKRTFVKQFLHSHACVFYLSQVFKQNTTTLKSCQNRPHTTHQFEKNNYVSESTSSQELQICGFLYDPARVVGMFFKIWKYFTTLPTSLPNNSQPPNFGISSILPPTSSYYHPLPPNLRILSRYFSHLINVFNTIMIYTTCLFYK